MREGLAIVVTPGGRWWPLVQVGWLKHEAGDEWVLVGARTLRRSTGRRTLSEVAKDGLLRDYVARPPSEEPEPLHRLLIRRVVYCRVESWATDCPRPDGWVERA